MRMRKPLKYFLTHSLIPDLWGRQTDVSSSQRLCQFSQGCAVRWKAMGGVNLECREIRSCVQVFCWTFRYGVEERVMGKNCKFQSLCTEIVHKTMKRVQVSSAVSIDKKYQGLSPATISIAPIPIAHDEEEDQRLKECLVSQVESQRVGILKGK